MLYAYMDPSGTHAGAPVLAIAGFIAEENIWIEFQTRWHAVLDDPKWPSRLTEFHMVDCANRDKEFFNGRWIFAECLTLYGELCRLIRDSEIIPIGKAVVRDIFQKLSPEDLIFLNSDNIRLGNPLDVCFQGILQQILRKVNRFMPGEKVGVIFDRESREVEEKFAQFCLTYWQSYSQGDLIAGIGFGDSKDVVGLQAADLLAYGTRELGELWLRPPDTEPYFPVIPALWNMLWAKAQNETTSPDGTIFDLHALREVLANVRQGKTLPKREVI